MKGEGPFTARVSRAIQDSAPVPILSTEFMQNLSVKESRSRDASPLETLTSPPQKEPESERLSSTFRASHWVQSLS
jgi:hypothetical protein